MGRTESSAPTNGSADVLTGRRDTRVPPYRVYVSGRTGSSAVMEYLPVPVR